MAMRHILGNRGIGPEKERGQKKMTTEGATAVRPSPADGPDDSTKRRQIMDGARAIFLAQGFDAASMGEIARAAGVSKGTLYVYFENKEELFEAIVHEQCHVQAEGLFNLDPSNPDVEAVLTKLGIDFVRFLCQPGKASPLRTVLASYIKTQVDAGLLAVDDCEVAAAQFLDACQSTLFKPVLFNFAPPPPPERIEHVVRIAVRTFLAAYRVR